MNQHPQLDFSVTIRQQVVFEAVPPQIIRGTFTWAATDRGGYYISTAPINDLGHYAWLYRSNRSYHHQRWCIYFGPGPGVPRPLTDPFTGHRFIERGILIPNARPRSYSGSVNPIGSVWVGPENTGLDSLTLTPHQQQLPPPPPPQQRQQPLPQQRQRQPPPQQQSQTDSDIIARRIDRMERGLTMTETILNERNDADVAEGRRLIAELRMESRAGGNLQRTIDRVNRELMTVIGGRIRGRIRQLFDVQYNLAIQSIAHQPQEFQIARQRMISQADLLFRTIANADGFIHSVEFQRWVNGLPQQYSNFIMNTIDWYPIFPLTSVNSMLNPSQFLVMLEHLDFMIAATGVNIQPITEYVSNFDPARMGGGVVLPPGPRPEAPGPLPAVQEIQGSNRIHPNVNYTFSQLAVAFNPSEAGNNRLARRLREGRGNPAIAAQIVHDIGKNATDPKGGVMALIKYIKETSELRVPAGARKIDAITSAGRLKALIESARTDGELLRLLISIPEPNEVEFEYAAMERRLVRLYTEGEAAADLEKRTLLCWFLVYGMRHDDEFSYGAPIRFCLADGTEEVNFSGYMAWAISYGFMMDQNPAIQKQWIEDFIRESLEAYTWGRERLNIDTISIRELRDKKSELQRGGAAGSISCGKGIVERTLYAISRVLSRFVEVPQQQEGEEAANDRRIKTITNWYQEYYNIDRGDDPMTEESFRKFIQDKISSQVMQPSETPAKWQASLDQYITSGLNANGRTNDLFYGGKRMRKMSKRRRTKRKGKFSRKF
jgi:hypothetical protein